MRVSGKFLPKKDAAHGTVMKLLCDTIKLSVQEDSKIGVDKHWCAAAWEKPVGARESLDSKASGRLLVDAIRFLLLSLWE